MTDTSTFRNEVERMTTLYQELLKKYKESKPPKVEDIRQSLVVPDGIDADIAAHTFWLLSRAEKENIEQAYTRAGPINERGYGVKVDSAKNFHISTIPGGLTVFVGGPYYTTPLLNLGMAFDITDGPLNHIRDSILFVLEESGIPFIPLSFDASARVGSIGDLRLIERVGRNCVFSRLSNRNGKMEYFISGYDENEDPPLYFMAQLPRKVSSYAKALEVLKPTSVKEAEKLDLSVLRQGDMFFIPTPYTKEDLVRMGATISDTVEIEKKAFVGRRYNVWIEGKSAYSHAEEYKMPDGRVLPIDDEGCVAWTESRHRGLYGTAHTADQIAYLPDGTQFAKGEVRHDPFRVLREDRQADHKPLALPGRKWHLVARNTVPVEKVRRVP